MIVVSFTPKSQPKNADTVKKYVPPYPKYTTRSFILHLNHAAMLMRH